MRGRFEGGPADRAHTPVAHDLEVAPRMSVMPGVGWRQDPAAPGCGRHRAARLRPIGRRSARHSSRPELDVAMVSELRGYPLSRLDTIAFPLRTRARGAESKGVREAAKGSDSTTSSAPALHSFGRPAAEGRRSPAIVRSPKVYLMASRCRTSSPAAPATRQSQKLPRARTR